MAFPCPTLPRASSTYLEGILLAGGLARALHHLAVDAEPEHRVGDVVVVRDRRHLRLSRHGHLLLLLLRRQLLYRNRFHRVHHADAAEGGCDARWALPVCCTGR